MHDYFYPRSVAVLGASATEGKTGHRLLRSLAVFGGAVYPVHPELREIEGRRVYPSLARLPEPVDLVVAVVPAARLCAAVLECPPGGARYLAAIPSGFGEASAEGAGIQRSLVAAARERGMRVVGPNVFGVINGPYGLNASLIPTLPLPGPGLSLLSQSGGYAMSAWMYARNHEFPIAKMCDLGNMADVGVDEVLDFYADDPDTRVIGLCLESVLDRERFRAALARAVAAKPVILTALGRTAAGRRASVDHIGIDSVDVREAAQSVCGAAGEARAVGDVIPAQSGLELLHVAKGLCWQPLPAGRRVAIVTGTGGVGAELTDLCVEHGLEVPALSSVLQARLAAHLPAYAPVSNPVDLTPVWRQFPHLYPTLIRQFAACDEVDLVIASVTDVPTEFDDMPAGLATAADVGKPVYVYWGCRPEGAEFGRAVQRARIPCYPSPLEAVRAAAAIAHHAAGTACRGSSYDEGR